MTVPKLPSKKFNPLVPLVIVAVVALLLATVYLLQRDGGSTTEATPGSSATAEQGAGENSSEPAPDSDSPSATDSAEAEQSDDEANSLKQFERRSPDDLLAVGPVDAPIALIVFSDYQCPYCGQWSTETLPVMMDLAEQGQLRIEWRDLNVFGPDSVRASHAAYAAAEQGKFWEYHAALFPNGEPRPKGQLSEEALIELARDLGLHADQFAADMSSEHTASVIQTNQELGFRLGASSTPTFIFGGAPIIGAHPTESFMQVYEALLAEQALAEQSPVDQSGAGQN